MRVRPAMLLVVGLALSLTSACKGKGQSEEGGEDGQARAPDGAGERPELAPLPEPKMIPSGDEEPLPESSAKVELPRAPLPEDLSPAEVPLVYDDDARSIRGLRQDLDRQIQAGEDGQEVEVRGWVQRIYVPPSGCEDEGGCRQPHLWIGDASRTKARRHQLMVTSYTFPIPEWDAARWAGQPELILEVGKQYLFRGKFVRISDMGVIDPRGLLQLTAVAGEDGEWIYPRGAPWHPIERARQERENAALRERVMKADRG